jgi:DNA-binding NarL/FixJ family response regulator
MRRLGPAPMLPDVGIRVLLADDHPVFLRGLRGLLDSDAHIRVVAHAENGSVALDQIREHRPDVAVLDLKMPKKDAFAVHLAVEHERLGAAVVILTAHADEALMDRARDLGIRGFIRKESSIAEIVACIKAVYEGRVYMRRLPSVPSMWVADPR